MLIIFDLDDTLIDTSSGIIPWKLDKMLRDLKQDGLAIPDVALAYELLLRLNEEADSTRSAVKEFFEIMDLDPSFFQKALYILYEEFSEDLPVYPLEGALKILESLSKEHHLAIVTHGKEDYQRFKIEKAGIDFSLFSTIAVSGETGKKNFYNEIRDSLGLPPSAICVCGDRIEMDLVPGKELGFTTIHMRCGRGLRPHRLGHYVDYTIHNIQELPDVIEKIEIVG